MFAFLSTKQKYEVPEVGCCNTPMAKLVEDFLDGDLWSSGSRQRMYVCDNCRTLTLLSQG
jgi:hypothetical protein